MTTKGQDIEKGLVSTTARSTMPSWVSSTPDHGNSNAATGQTPLQVFQMLVGIDTPASLTQDGVELKRGNEERAWRVRNDNVGLYQRAKAQERSSRIAYLVTAYVTNTLYVLQILLAATFTALSSYKRSLPITLTVLGALNTVLAGFLAWHKGQGIPQRFRKAQDQYQALILEIEMTERSFLGYELDHSGVKLDPRTETDRLQKMYDTARADQQANFPDLYVSTGGNTSVDSRKELEAAKAEFAKVQSDLMARIEALASKLEGVHGQTGVAGQSTVKMTHVG